MSRSCRRCFRGTVKEGCQEGVPKREVEEKRRKMRREKVTCEIAQEVVAGTKENRAKDSQAKCQAKLGLLANRKRRNGVRGRPAKRGPDGNAMGGR